MLSRRVVVKRAPVRGDNAAYTITAFTQPRPRDGRVSAGRGMFYCRLMPYAHRLQARYLYTLYGKLTKLLLTHDDRQAELR